MTAGAIDEARRLLEEVTGLAAVARPEDLEKSRALLDRAASQFAGAIRGLGNEPVPARAASHAAIAGYARELKKVAALHRHAHAFHAAWLRLVEEFSGAAYSPAGGAGLPALTPPGRRVSLVA
jgi:hypothetical protein